VLKLELVDLLQLAHPYIKGIEKVHYCLSQKECWAVAHGKFESPQHAFIIDGKTSEQEHIRQMNLTPEEVKSIQKIYTTTFYIGLKIKPISGKSRKYNVWSGYLLIDYFFAP
jgi:poly(A) polymerase